MPWKSNWPSTSWGLELHMAAAPSHPHGQSLHSPPKPQTKPRGPHPGQRHRTLAAMGTKPFLSLSAEEALG